MSEYDVIVVGAGNAAFCAALAAQEQGASVLMLEAAPEQESGGNSRFTAGSIRVVYNGVEDIKTLVPDLTQAEIATTDFGTYTQEQPSTTWPGHAAPRRSRSGRADGDPELRHAVLDARQGRAASSRSTAARPSRSTAQFKFWGGLTVECGRRRARAWSTC